MAVAPAWVMMDDQNPIHPPATPNTAAGPLQMLAVCADAFAPITLAQMHAVALLDRVDVKFVLPAAQLAQVLAGLEGDYRVLVVQGERLNHYRTLYFDTPAFDLYLAHANDRADRYKVRTREYVASHMSFLEVKHKTPKDRTIKDRVMTRQPVTEMTPEMAEWLRSVSPVNAGALEPKLWNNFRRMTLVNVEHGERVTIDVDLAFFTRQRGVHLDGLAVVEVKRAANGAPSPFLAQMRAFRVRPRSFSKYSIGVGLLVDHVKKNMLKAKLHWLQKTLQQIKGELSAGAGAPHWQLQSS